MKMIRGPAASSSGTISDEESIQNGQTPGSLKCSKLQKEACVSLRPQVTFRWDLPAVGGQAQGSKQRAYQLSPCSSLWDKIGIWSLQELWYRDVGAGQAVSPVLVVVSVYLYLFGSFWVRSSGKRTSTRFLCQQVEWIRSPCALRKALQCLRSE